MKIFRLLSFLHILGFCNFSLFAQIANQAPVLTATGNQYYCSGSPINIVTDFNIVDPDDNGIDFIYIQISEGFISGQDLLTLTGNHPTILTTWDSAIGKMTLSGNGAQPTYNALIAAVKSITFFNSTTNPSGIRKFSITIDQANYLPSNGHYYRFIPNVGITWKDAKTAAQASTYYGLQGYLATITAADESQLAGKQSAGAGWIGGSDEITEGQWQWMTGPETGQNFVYSNWNSSEPNDLNGEDYAHVTAVGVGISGSWNDLSNVGGTSGNYQPKGYIVEYGGTPGDPLLQIATNSTINIPAITNFANAQICGAGNLTLLATANTGQVHWYDAAVGGNLVSTSNSFTTPVLSSTTNYYAVAHHASCPDVNRILVTATIVQIPIITVNAIYNKCKDVALSVAVTTTFGIINWYDTQSATTPIFTGNVFNVPNITQDTIFYVQANENGCVSARTAVTFLFFDSPVVTDEILKLCPNEQTFLEVQMPGMTYLWSTGEITSMIETNGTTTNYSVVITNGNNCSKTKQFNLAYQLVPEIANIVVKDLVVTINTVNPGDFEYSLDQIYYQDSNIFYFTQSGNYTVYVRDKTECGFDKQNFSVIKFQDFFTPNNDSYNDVWLVNGMAENPKFEVSVYDRFGKLLTFLNSKKTSWDGTFNGQDLPADDYWYVCKLDSGQVLRGHFSLKR